MSAIQGIEGVISQLQTTAMSARAQESLPQPTISFAGQLARRARSHKRYTNSRPHAGRKIHSR